MLKVNNKKTIRHLSNKSFTANKMRNLIAVIAIALTTILFTSIFTMGIGTVESLQKAIMRQAGGDGHAVLKYITDDEFNSVKGHSSIDKIAYNRILCDGVGNEELLKRHAEFWYYDEIGLELGFIDLKEGTLPQKENEVIADSMTLQLLGVPCEIGENVSLELNIKGETVNREFVLSGYWSSDPAFNVGQIFSSRTYVEKHLDELQNSYYEDYSLTGVICAYIMFDSSFKLEEKLNTLITDCGFSLIETDQNYMKSNVNWSYLSTNFGMDFGTIITLSLGLLLIVFTGYLIIYNIFQISVIQDVRFYGLLKTIGTTSKQIKKIITLQALKLCIFSIPLGLVIGFFVGKLLVPQLMNNSSYSNSEVSVSINPIIFIGATLFSLFTVYLSTRKPCKTASKISPVEAVRFTNNENSSIKAIKKNSKMRMIDFAVLNLGRDKKRTTITVISLSLCIVLLNTVFILSSSFDMDKFLDKFFDTDFLVAHADYFNNDFHGSNNSTSEKMISQIKVLEGFKEGGRLYGGRQNSFLSSIPEGKTARNKTEKGEVYITLYGLENFPFGRLELIDGEIDQEKLLSGKYILEGVHLDDNNNPRIESINYNIGDSVTLKNWAETENNTFTVLGHVAIKTYINSDRTYSDNTFYLPSEVYLTMVENPAVMSYAFNVADDFEESAEAFLKDYTSNIEPTMNFESKKTTVNSFINMKNTVLSIGGMLSGIIGFIGILNFVNAMITSIISRKKEFATLQSIGMTRRQLKKMLCYEGYCYAVLSAIFSLVIGVFCALFIAKPLCNMMWFMSFHLVLFPLLIAIPILFAFGYIIPTIIYGTTDKYSIVERLRMAE